MPLRFRMAERDDSNEIVSLLNATFRTPIDVPTWEWYVYGNPNGPSRIYLALEPSDDAIAGVVGFNPIPLRLEDATVMCDYGHHLAIKPAYRDTMSYLALMRHVLRAQAAGPTHLAIGPPNRTAYPIHKALMRWHDFGFIDCLRKLAPQGQAHSCRQITTFPHDFDRFYAEVSKDLRFCVSKNREWVNWRFFQRPGSVYTTYAATDSAGLLVGYVVLKLWREPNGYSKAHILDLHALNDEALSELLAAAECYATGCDELNLWAVQGYPYRTFLESSGFSPSHRQPLLAWPYNGFPVPYPSGSCSLAYGDGDTQY